MDTQVEYKGYILFVGYGRSGHSVVANILNQHPEILISDEIGILRNINGTKEKIIDKTANIAKRRPPKYSSLKKNVKYISPDTNKELVYLIGDKHANHTTNYLSKNFQLIERFNNKMGNVKLIHVIRNPYDIISTKFIRKKKNRWKKDMDNTIKEFKILANTVQKIKKKYEVFDIRLENLIEKPVSNICRMFYFTGANFSIDMVRSYSEVLMKEPSITRTKTKWTDKQIKIVQNIINEHDFLNGYGYNT